MSASDFMQLIRPFSVLRMMSLQSLQKFDELVIGFPSGWVMIEATPVATENEFCIS
jgi:hypothetical protein